MAYHDAYSWAKGGFLGVDAFFVLSGFLITTLLVLEWRRAQRIGLVAFWGRRIRRLLPALLLVIVFVAIYAWIAVPPLEQDRVRWDGIAGLFYVANWRFIATGPVVLRPVLRAVAVPAPVVARDRGAVLPGVAAGRARVPEGRDVAASGCSSACASSGPSRRSGSMSALYDADDPSRAYFGTDSRAHTHPRRLPARAPAPRTGGRRRARRSIAIQVLGVIGALGRGLGVARRQRRRTQLLRHRVVALRASRSPR